MDRETEEWWNIAFRRKLFMAKENVYIMIRGVFARTSPDPNVHVLLRQKQFPSESYVPPLFRFSVHCRIRFTLQLEVRSHFDIQTRGPIHRSAPRSRDMARTKRIGGAASKVPSASIRDILIPKVKIEHSPAALSDRPAGPVLPSSAAAFSSNAVAMASSSNAVAATGAMASGSNAVAADMHADASGCSKAVEHARKNTIKHNIQCKGCGWLQCMCRCFGLLDGNGCGWRQGIGS